mgnify:FL=1
MGNQYFFLAFNWIRTQTDSLTDIRQSLARRDNTCATPHLKFHRVHTHDHEIPMYTCTYTNPTWPCLRSCQPKPNYIPFLVMPNGWVVRGRCFKSTFVFIITSAKIGKEEINTNKSKRSQLYFQKWCLYPAHFTSCWYYKPHKQVFIDVRCVYNQTVKGRKRHKRLNIKKKLAKS